MDFLFEIIKLPWLGAKIIVRVIAISSLMVPSQVRFAPPTLSVSQGRVFLETRIENACTPRIKELLVNATPIVVNLTIEADGFSKSASWEYSYDPVSRSGRVLGPEGMVAETFADTSRLDSVFAMLRCELFAAGEIGRYRGKRMTLRAEAHVKQKMVDIDPENIWPSEPSLAFTFDLE